MTGPSPPPAAALSAPASCHPGLSPRPPAPRPLFPRCFLGPPDLPEPCRREGQGRGLAVPQEAGGAGLGLRRHRWRKERRAQSCSYSWWIPAVLLFAGCWSNFC